METAVSISNIKKSYDDFIAVHDMSFSINKAECFGLLGPNGAGKTTMMKMLYGRIASDTGSIRVFGLDPWHDGLSVRNLTGVVPQDDNLDTDLDVSDNLRLYAGFYGIRGKSASKRIDELLGFMELGEKRKGKIRELSGGMKRRLVIARALLNSPKFLILDEPTTGLDPQVRHLIWDKLRSLRDEGMTILLTTHYMEEASQICDRVIIMDKGRAMIEGNPAKLVSENIERFVLETQCNEAAERITAQPDAAPLRRDDSRNPPLFYGNDISLMSKMSEIVGRTGSILRQSNLEDLFLKTTGRTLNEHQ